MKLKQQLNQISIDRVTGKHSSPALGKGCAIVSLSWQITPKDAGVCVRARVCA